MKKRLTIFVRSFYFNTEVLKAYKLTGLLTFILLIVNIMLVSVPPVVGTLDSTPNYDDFPGINEAFHDIYERQLPCTIDDQTFHCDEDIDAFQAGNYTFDIVEGVSEDLDVDESKIYFSENEAAIVYVEGDTQTILSATYATQPPLDFEQVYARAQEASDPLTHYDTQTQSFVNNLYFSNVGSTMLVIYPAQFAQMGMYVLLVGFMIMISNYKAKFKKITVPSALKITIAAMTGPALVTALLGLLIPQWSILIFTIAYLVRIIAIYFQINATETPLY